MGILRTIGRRAAPAGFALGITAAAVLTAANPASAANVAATLSAESGPSGGGNTIVVTAASHGLSAPGTSLFVQFQRKATTGQTCTSDYATPGATVFDVPDADVTAVGANNFTVEVPAEVVTVAGAAFTDYNLCSYISQAASPSATAWTAVGTPYRVVPNYTLSPQTGPTGGNNTITLTAPAGYTPFSSAFGVQFQAATPSATAPTNYCTRTWAATVPVANTPAGVVPIPAAAIGVVTSSKIVITVPNNIGATFALGFHICLYDETPGTPANADTNVDLIGAAPAPYTVGTPAAITSVTPKAGPAQGGNTITVVGTGFASGMTASLAGVPLTPLGVTSTGFTAVMPARVAGGPFKLSVTTTAGTHTTAAGVYTYSNGIVIEPNTAPNTSLNKTWVSVRGVGFEGLTFSATTGATPNSTNGHVYLAKGAYDSKPLAGGIAGAKGNGQVTECVGVIVIDDRELICGLYLAGNQPTPASRTLSGCSAVALNATTITSSNSPTCTFTPADIGMTITSNAAGMPTNTIITAVASATSATISKGVSTAIAATTPTFTLSGSRAITAATVSTSANTVAATAATGPFTALDVGKRVTGTGIPVDTFITGVTTGTATLSNTPTVAGTDVALTLVNPVPVGSYTLTVVSNGGANAETTDENYSQSIISSGSTFTVADY
jgi:hypothetical protein